MSDLWVPDKTIRKRVLPRCSVDSEGEVQEMLCSHFQQYDAMIVKIGCTDELSG